MLGMSGTFDRTWHRGCSPDLGFSALSGQTIGLTFGTRPLAEHNQIRTTSFEGGRGYAVGLDVPLAITRAMPAQPI